METLTERLQELALTRPSAYILLIDAPRIPGDFLHGLSAETRAQLIVGSFGEEDAEDDRPLATLFLWLGYTLALRQQTGAPPVHFVLASDRIAPDLSRMPWPCAQRPRISVVAHRDALHALLGEQQ